MAATNGGATPTATAAWGDWTCADVDDEAGVADAWRGGPLTRGGIPLFRGPT